MLSNDWSADSGRWRDLLLRAGQGDPPAPLRGRMKDKQKEGLGVGLLPFHRK